MVEEQAWTVCLQYLRQQVFQTRASIAVVRKQVKPLGKRNANIKHAVDGGSSICIK
jgi:hypothetical protein